VVIKVLVSQGYSRPSISVKRPAIITEYHLYGFICPVCGRIVWAKLPAGVIEGQLFSLRLQALIGYMRGSLHASYSALEDFCREVLNIDVARSHLCNTIYCDSDALTGPYEQLLQRHNRQ